VTITRASNKLRSSIRKQGNFNKDVWGIGKKPSSSIANLTPPTLLETADVTSIENCVLVDQTFPDSEGISSQSGSIVANC
jgi:hypothetical protein